MSDRQTIANAMPKIENHDRGQAGEAVFYAHGSESLRTYLGLSKFHSRADCPALTRRGGGAVVQDRIADVSPSQRCKVCHPGLGARKRPAAPAALW